MSKEEASGTDKTGHFVPPAADSRRSPPRTGSAVGVALSPCRGGRTDPLVATDAGSLPGNRNENGGPLQVPEDSAQAATPSDVDSGPDLVTIIDSKDVSTVQGLKDSLERIESAISKGSHFEIPPDLDPPTDPSPIKNAAENSPISPPIFHRDIDLTSMVPVEERHDLLTIPSDVNMLDIAHSSLVSDFDKALNDPDCDGVRTSDEDSLLETGADDLAKGNIDVSLNFDPELETNRNSSPAHTDASLSRDTVTPICDDGSVLATDDIDKGVDSGSVESIPVHSGRTNDAIPAGALSSSRFELDRTLVKDLIEVSKNSTSDLNAAVPSTCVSSSINDCADDSSSMMNSLNCTPPVSSTDLKAANIVSNVTVEPDEGLSNEPSCLERTERDLSSQKEGPESRHKSSVSEKTPITTTRSDSRCQNADASDVCHSEPEDQATREVQAETTIPEEGFVISKISDEDLLKDRSDDSNETKADDSDLASSFKIAEESSLGYVQRPEKDISLSGFGVVSSTKASLREVNASDALTKEDDCSLSETSRTQEDVSKSSEVKDDVNEDGNRINQDEICHREGSSDNIKGSGNQEQKTSPDNAEEGIQIGSDVAQIRTPSGQGEENPIEPEDETKVNVKSNNHTADCQNEKRDTKLEGCEDFVCRRTKSDEEVVVDEDGPTDNVLSSQDEFFDCQETAESKSEKVTYLEGKNVRIAEEVGIQEVEGIAKEHLTTSGDGQSVNESVVEVVDGPADRNSEGGKISVNEVSRSDFNEGVVEETTGSNPNKETVEESSSQNQNVKKKNSGTIESEISSESQNVDLTVDPSSEGINTTAKLSSEAVDEKKGKFEKRWSLRLRSREALARNSNVSNASNVPSKGRDRKRSQVEGSVRVQVDRISLKSRSYSEPVRAPPSEGEDTKVSSDTSGEVSEVCLTPVEERSQDPYFDATERSHNSSNVREELSDNFFASKCKVKTEAMFDLDLTIKVEEMDLDVIRAAEDPTNRYDSVSVDNGESNVPLSVMRRNRWVSVERKKTAKPRTSKIEKIAKKLVAGVKLRPLAPKPSVVQNTQKSSPDSNLLLAALGYKGLPKITSAVEILRVDSPKALRKKPDLTPSVSLIPTDMAYSSPTSFDQNAFPLLNASESEASSGKTDGNVAADVAIPPVVLSLSNLKVELRSAQGNASSSPSTACSRSNPASTSSGVTQEKQCSTNSLETALLSSQNRRKFAAPLNVPSIFPSAPRPRGRPPMFKVVQHRYVEAFYRTRTGAIKKKFVKVPYFERRSDRNDRTRCKVKASRSKSPVDVFNLANVEVIYTNPPSSSTSQIGFNHQILNVPQPSLLKQSEKTQTGDCGQDSVPGTRGTSSRVRPDNQNKVNLEFHSKEVGVPESVLNILLHENNKTDYKTDSLKTDKRRDSNERGLSSATSSLLNIPHNGSSGSEEVVFNSNDLKVILVQPESELHSSKKTSLIPLCDNDDKRIGPSDQTHVSESRRNADPINGEPTETTLPESIAPSKSPDIVLLPKSVAERTKAAESTQSDKSLMILKVLQHGVDEDSCCLVPLIPHVSETGDDPQTKSAPEDKPDPVRSFEKAVPTDTSSKEGGRSGMVSRRVPGRRKHDVDHVAKKRSRLSTAVSTPPLPSDVGTPSDDTTTKRIVLSNVKRGCGGEVSILKLSQPLKQSLPCPATHNVLSPDVERTGQREQQDAIYRLRRLGTDVSLEDQKVTKNLRSGNTVLVTPVEDCEYRPPAIKLLEDMAKSTELPISSPVLTALGPAVRSKRKSQNYVENKVAPSDSQSISVNGAMPVCDRDKRSLSLEETGPVQTTESNVQNKLPLNDKSDLSPVQIITRSSVQSCKSLQGVLVDKNGEDRDDGEVSVDDTVTNKPVQSTNKDVQINLSVNLDKIDVDNKRAQKDESNVSITDDVVVLDETRTEKRDKCCETDESKCSGVFLIRPQHYVKTIDNEQMWCCDICTVVCSQQQLFRKHYLRLHISPKYISERDKEMWNIVEEGSDEEKLFKCHVCKVRLDSKSDLKNHLEHHPKKEDSVTTKSPNQYVCPNCDSVFKWRKLFGKHKKTCMENTKKSTDPTHHCLYCNETFFTPYKKKNHILSNHPYTRRKHPCVFCSKVFPSNIALFNHLVDHHSSVFFGCTTCKERFLNVEQLRAHYRKTHPTDNFKVKDPTPLAKEYFDCGKCDRVFLIESCLNKHDCTRQIGEKDKEKIIKRKRIKPLLIERKIEGRRTVGETDFFSKVSANIQDNLTYHLDGKLHPIEAPNHVSSSQRTILNFNACVPPNAVSTQTAEKPISKSPNTPTYEKFTFPKEYDGRCGLTSFIKDASYLDLSTQLIMRRNLQRLNLLAENTCDSQSDVPAVLALERLGTQCAESFGVSETTTGEYEGEEGEDRAARVVGELSGEWVRERTYVCATCLWQSPCLWSMEDHKYTAHPHVWTPQHELNTPNHKHIASFAYRRLVETSREERRDRCSRREKYECTKCGVADIRTKPDLHRHIMECSGEDLAALETLHNAAVVRLPATKRRPKWRGGGRRTRQGLKRNIPNTPPAQNLKRNKKLLRTKPGDADTIEKMIANLPAKRATRRVLGFDEIDIKTRSQATIQNTSTVMNPQGSVKKPFKSSDKLSPPKKMEKKVQGIDTSAENGNVLSSLRMMPVKKADSEVQDVMPPRLEVEVPLVPANVDKEIPVLTPVTSTLTVSSKTLLGPNAIPIKSHVLPPSTTAILVLVPPLQHPPPLVPFLPKDDRTKLEVVDASTDPICSASITQGKIDNVTVAQEPSEPHPKQTDATPAPSKTKKKASKMTDIKKRGRPSKKQNKAHLNKVKKETMKKKSTGKKIRACLKEHVKDVKTSAGKKLKGLVTKELSHKRQKPVPIKLQKKKKPVKKNNKGKESGKTPAKNSKAAKSPENSKNKNVVDASKETKSTENKAVSKSPENKSKNAENAKAEKTIGKSVDSGKTNVKGSEPVASSVKNQESKSCSGPVKDSIDSNVGKSGKNSGSGKTVSKSPTGKSGCGKSALKNHVVSPDNGKSSGNSLGNDSQSTDKQIKGAVSNKNTEGADLKVETSEELEESTSTCVEDSSEINEDLGVKSDGDDVKTRAQLSSTKEESLKKASPKDQDGKKGRKRKSDSLVNESEKEARVEEEKRLKVELKQMKEEARLKKLAEKKQLMEERKRQREEARKAKEEEKRRREDEKKRKEEEKRLAAERKVEEERMKKEEIIKKEQEEEQRRIAEEEKRRKDEEEKRLKMQEEKEIEEERKLKLKEEEKRLREEEERKRKEDEKKRKEDEKKRKEEEKRRRDEEERKRKEEEKKRKEEEKKRKEEEKRKREEEERKHKEEKQKREEEEKRMREEEERKRQELEKLKKEEEERKRLEEETRKEEEKRKREEEERKRLEEEKLKREEEEKQKKEEEEKKRLTETKLKEDDRKLKTKDDKTNRSETKSNEEENKKYEESEIKDETRSTKSDNEIGSTGEMSPQWYESEDSKMSDSDSQKSLRLKQQKKRSQKKEALSKLNRITLAHKLRRKKLIQKMKESGSNSGKEVISSGSKWSVEVSKDLPGSEPHGMEVVDWLSDIPPVTPPVLKPVPPSALGSDATASVSSSNLTVQHSSVTSSSSGLAAPDPLWRDSNSFQSTSTNLGSILDSVNTLLNEPDLTMYNTPLMQPTLGPPQYSLADLQRAMGASDAEMAVLQQLGEIKVEENKEEEWNEVSIIDLDKQDTASKSGAVDVSPLGQCGAAVGRVASALNEASASTTWDPSVKPSSSFQSVQMTSHHYNNSPPVNVIHKAVDKKTHCYPSSRTKDASSALLAAHPGKEVVCPTCSCHFIGFPALQLHISKYHPVREATTHLTSLDAKAMSVRRMSTNNCHKQDLSMLNKRALLESAKGSRLICFMCQQILPSNLMSSHLVVEHLVKPKDITKCQPISEPVSNESGGGENLKNKMSSALGDLLDRAVNNLLTAKQEGSTRMSGSAMQLLDKLSALRKREEILQRNQATSKEVLLKVYAKSKLEAALKKGLSNRVKQSNYSCGICGARFLWEKSWSRHVLDVHTRLCGIPNVDEIASDADDPEEDDWRAESGDDGEAEGRVTRAISSSHVVPICSDCGLGFESMSDLLFHRSEIHKKPQRRGSTNSAQGVSAVTSRTSSRSTTPVASTPSSLRSVSPPPSLSSPAVSQSQVSTSTTKDVGSNLPPPSISPAPTDVPPTIAPEPPPTRLTRRSASYFNPPTPPPPVLTPEGEVKKDLLEEGKGQQTNVKEEKKDSVKSASRKSAPVRRSGRSSNVKSESASAAPAVRRTSSRNDAGSSSDNSNVGKKSISIKLESKATDNVGNRKAKSCTAPENQNLSTVGKRGSVKTDVGQSVSCRSPSTVSGSNDVPPLAASTPLSVSASPSNDPKKKLRKRSNPTQPVSDSRPKRVMSNNEDENVRKKAEVALRELNLTYKIKQAQNISASNTSIRWRSAMTFSPKPKNESVETTPEKTPPTSSSSSSTTIYDFVDDLPP